jgi:hypothetical protein
MRKPVLFFLLVVMLVLSSCGPAVKPAAGPVTETGETFTIALPRVTVDYDLQGNPSVEGIDLKTLDGLLGGFGVPRLSDMLRLPSNMDYAGWMMRANIQHIEVRQAGNGLIVFVNSKPMPYVAWDDASLQKVSALTALYNGQPGQLDLQFLGRLMPIVRRLGMDLVLRFPKQDGATAIALTDPNSTAELATKTTGTPASVIVQFEVKYDANGVPAILGISADELNARGIKLGNYVLAPSAIQSLQAANVQSVELRGKEDGLYVYLNGDPLPNLVWDNTFLANAADVYGQMNDQSNAYVQAVKQLLPMVNKADLGVLIHFPVASTQQPIAVKMH